MFEKILEVIKNPVTTMIEKSENEDIKKGTIKLAIISAIMSLMSIISMIAAIFSEYSKKRYRYESRTSSELFKLRWEAIKDAELFGTFFKTWVIMAVAIAIGALILYIINKAVKNSKEYSNTLSMVNNTMIIYIIGSILKTIVSWIYVPLGLLILYATIVYASFTLINAFRDSLELESTDKLVVVTTGVLTALMVISVVVFCSITKVSLKDITTITELLDF